VAYVLSKTAVSTQRILMMLIMLPMWINFLLRTYAWLSLLENTGLINRLLMFLGLPTMSIINTQGAVVLGNGLQLPALHDTPRFFPLSSR
jgi:spermidine/putrescine transport system permease protein